jgi:hypothetical protein
VEILWSRKLKPVFVLGAEYVIFLPTLGVARQNGGQMPGADKGQISVGAADTLMKGLPQFILIPSLGKISM